MYVRYNRKLCRHIIPEIRVGRKAQGQMGRGVVSAADVAQQQTTAAAVIIGGSPFFMDGITAPQIVCVACFLAEESGGDKSGCFFTSRIRRMSDLETSFNKRQKKLAAKQRKSSVSSSEKLQSNSKTSAALLSNKARRKRKGATSKSFQKNILHN